MPREREGLPPPLRGARKRPDMMDDTQPRGGGGVYGRMSELAGMGGEMDAGNEEQAAQLIMSAAQQLMQAAQICPQTRPMVERILAVLKSGADELSGGGGGMGEEELGGLEETETPERRPKKRKRIRPPAPESGPEEEMGSMMG